MSLVETMKPLVETTTYGLNSLQYTTVIIWNDIHQCIDTLAEFKVYYGNIWEKYYEKKQFYLAL